MPMVNMQVSFIQLIQKDGNTHKEKKVLQSIQRKFDCKEYRFVVWLFLEVPWVCLQFALVVFSDHTHYLCFNKKHLFRFLQISEVSCQFIQSLSRCKSFYSLAY